MTIYLSQESIECLYEKTVLCTVSSENGPAVRVCTYDVIMCASSEACVSASSSKTSDVSVVWLLLLW